MNDSVRLGLRLLLQARLYTEAAKLDSWQFAIEVRFLHSLGMTSDELSWLAENHYVEHAIEISQPASPLRSFRPSDGSIAFDKKACFVLTDRGKELISPTT